MPGFNQTPTPVAEAPKANRAQNNANVNAFNKQLPDINNTIKELLSYTIYFALCPNGKRIRVEDLCKEYARDPTGLAYRTFDDRLVLVLQAVNLGDPTYVNYGNLTEIPIESGVIYWQQAFYLSTGESSGMGGTWLPFNGILIKSETERELIRFYPSYERRERRANEKTLQGTAWFSKDIFGAPQDRSFFRFSSEMTAEERKVERLYDTYGRLYLPEGNYLYYKSPFDRIATLSYALASHAIGGNLFAQGDGGTSLRVRYSLQGIPDTIKDQVETRLNTPSPLQSCFAEMGRTYPITKPNVVNAYIDKEKGVYYMNAFRKEGIFPPGLAFAQVPMKSLGYSMPVKTYWDALANAVREIWTDYHLGKLTLDDVKAIFANPRGQIEAYMKKHREYSVMPNEQDFSFNLHRESYGFRPGMLNYYGGLSRRRLRKASRKSKRKSQGKATRKH